MNNMLGIRCSKIILSSETEHNEFSIMQNQQLLTDFRLFSQT